MYPLIHLIAYYINYTFTKCIFTLQKGGVIISTCLWPCRYETTDFICGFFCWLVNAIRVRPSYCKSVEMNDFAICSIGSCKYL